MNRSMRRECRVPRPGSVFIFKSGIARHADLSDNAVVSVSRHMALKPRSHLFRVGAMPTSRIEAFSDGVFAIVITLLILSIQVPPINGDPGRVLGGALLGMIPKFLSYTLSFGIICIWWVAHHHLYILIAKTDRGLLWLNSLFLFFLASVPFPTALLGDFPRQRRGRRRLWRGDGAGGFEFLINEVLRVLHWQTDDSWHRPDPAEAGDAQERFESDASRYRGGAGVGEYDGIACALRCHPALVLHTNKTGANLNGG